MATNNVDNAPFPLSATQGGLGVASPTAHGILVGEGSSAATSIVLTAGQVLVGTTASDPVGATITGSGGVTVNSSSGAISIVGSGNGWTWNDQTTSASLVKNNSYIADSASLVTMTLPATAAIGDMFQIVGKGAGGWKIAQNASGQINFGNVATTVGTGGSLASSNQYDCVTFVCITANNIYSVYNAIGNLTYV